MANNSKQFALKKSAHESWMRDEAAEFREGDRVAVSFNANDPRWGLGIVTRIYRPEAQRRLIVDFGGQKVVFMKTDRARIAKVIGIYTRHDYDA